MHNSNDLSRIFYSTEAHWYLGVESVVLLKETGQVRPCTQIILGDNDNTVWNSASEIHKGPNESFDVLVADGDVTKAGRAYAHEKGIPDTYDALRALAREL